MDEVVMGVLPEYELRVVLVTSTQVAQTARQKHGARGAAAHVLGESITAAALLSALQLQKSKAKVNLQLECDGPLRGLFVESDSGGGVRGYVKNPYLAYAGQPGAYQWRPVYGNSGFLSVLRDPGNGDFFRSSVELEAFDLTLDFERFFQVSEQVPTGVVLHVTPKRDEPLSAVAGILLQVMPGGDEAKLKAMIGRFREEGLLARTLEGGGAELHASQLLGQLLQGEVFEVTSRYPLQWSCPCSKDRVVRALLTLGKAELQDILQKDGKAEATCQFCSGTYVVDGEELRGLIARF